MYLVCVSCLGVMNGFWFGVGYVMLMFLFGFVLGNVVVVLGLVLFVVILNWVCVYWLWYRFSLIVMWLKSWLRCLGCFLFSVGLWLVCVFCCLVLDWRCGCVVYNFCVMVGCGVWDFDRSVYVYCLVWFFCWFGEKWLLIWSCVIVVGYYV